MNVSACKIDYYKSGSGFFDPFCTKEEKHNANGSTKQTRKEIKLGKKTSRDTLS